MRSMHNKAAYTSIQQAKLIMAALTAVCLQNIHNGACAYLILRSRVHQIRWVKPLISANF